MKREVILFYMANDKIYLYRVNAKKESIIELDTSAFFSFGEISSVEKFRDTLSKIQTKMNFNSIYLKPNIVIMYNDVVASDLKFLYEASMKVFDYNKIKFVPLSKVAKSIKDDENLVLFDKDYYTLIGRGEKSMGKDFDFEPIFIGECDKNHVHYSDVDILWKKFKDTIVNLVD